MRKLHLTALFHVTTGAVVLSSWHKGGIASVYLDHERARSFAQSHKNGRFSACWTAPPPTQPPIPTKTKNQNIQVSPAVLDAARKDGEALLRDLQTSLAGLTEAEAEERARTAGPNEIAQERKQGWPIRLLKIIRNPLVILLTTLSAVSFLTGDARAGSVMAMMVALSVGLRFWQEARADAAAEKLKAMIHVTATVVRDGAAREIPLRELVPGDIIKLAAGDMIPGDVRLLSFERPVREPRQPHR